MFDPGYDDIYSSYKQFQKDGVKNEIACAILALTAQLEKMRDYMDDNLSHEICLGIRHGLFGSNATGNDTIESLSHLRVDDLGVTIY